MAFYYYTDTPVDPSHLIRIRAANGSSPSNSTSTAFWSSPSDRWDFRTGSWVEDNSLTWKVFGSGEYEPIVLADVEDVKAKIRARYAGLE